MYLQPPFNPDEAGLITARLRALVADMNVLKPEEIEKIRQCFDADVGCREAARKLNVNRNTIVAYYHRFKLEPKSDKLNLGDPTPDRSALATFKPWTPIYDDKPVRVEPKKHNETTMLVDDALPEIPTADQVAAAMVTASKLVGADPIAAATDYGSKNLESSKARAYAALALEALFPKTSRPAISRLVGIPRGKSDQVFLAVLNSQIKTHRMKWFKPEVLAKVKAGVTERSKVADL